MKNKILKKFKNDYDMIIRLYEMDKLYLSPWELNKYLKLRGEKTYPHYKLIEKRQVIVK